MDSTTSSTVICSKCSKVFGRKWSLERHEKSCSNVSKKDNEDENKNVIRCPEDGCGQILSGLKLLKNHVKECHGVELKEQNLHFPNFDAFITWKKKVEKDNLCRYTVRGTVRLKDGNRKHYHCHRSGYYNSRSTGKRRCKSQGSNRINSTCTSSLVVTENVGGVEVNFCATHFGHGSNLGRCYLTSEERSMIAGKIAEGVSFDKILDEFRNNIENIYDPKALISKKDLHNIERDFHLIEGKAHSSDYVSVCLWLQKMTEDSQNQNQSPVLYSNLENEDIFLVLATEFQLEMLEKFGGEKICIDSTHGTTEYETYLTTILVVDEFGNGFPVSFCFSKRKDTNAWATFFSKVKERVGVIKPKIFMTDDDPAFYNAWCAVMGRPDKKLLCSWHVDQNWRKQIQVKVGGSLEKKTYVYKSLKILQHEPKIEDFKSLLKSICDELENDEETKDFYEYFVSNYKERAEQWAYSHRQKCGINTNMYLEAVHKTLKYYYLKGRKNKRMDLCINALLKFIRDKTFERFIKLSKNKYTAKEDCIARSHLAAVQSTDLKIVPTSLNTWNVESATLKNVSYEVRKLQDSCDVESCKLKCRVCEICIHIFQCECPDFIIKWNICKHIHSIILLSKKEEGAEKAVNHEYHDNFEIKRLEKALVNHEEITVDEKNRTEIIDKLMVAVGLLKTRSYSEQEYVDINKKVDFLLNAAKGNKRKLIDVTNTEPSNKKIDKQIRFTSSKKQKRVSNKLQNDASVRERIEIKRYFTSSTPTHGVLAISSQTQNDHLY